MSIGSQIKKLREQHKLDRYELARKIGVSYFTIAKYENDERTPPPETLEKLADCFKTTTDYLLGRETDKPSRPRPTQAEKDEILRLFDSLSEEEQTAFLKKLLLRPKKEDN